MTDFRDSPKLGDGNPYITLFTAIFSNFRDNPNLGDVTSLPFPGEVSAKADGGVLEEVKEEQYLGIIKMFSDNVLEKVTL